MPTNPLQQLEADVEKNINFSNQQAILYGWIHHVTRVSLIVLSALAAAKGMVELTPYVAWFAVVVAIGTALDTWLQPGTLWKAHYRYNDEFTSFRRELGFAKNDEDVQKLSERFKALDSEYREAVLGKK